MPKTGVQDCQSAVDSSGHYEEQFCEIILNLGQWFMRGPLRDFLSGALDLWQPPCSVERNHLCNFGRGHHGLHSCEVPLNLDLSGPGEDVI